MSARDSFSVYLHDLPADGIGFRVSADNRHILQITMDVALYVRPKTDDLSAVIAGLRKLAAAADEMAGALSRIRHLEAPEPQAAAEDGPCEQWAPGEALMCSQPKGHRGVHEARGANDELLAAWSES